MGQLPAKIQTPVYKAQNTLHHSSHTVVASQPSTMLSCQYRSMTINHFCVVIVALANVSPALCGILYGDYRQQSAPLTLNPGPSPPSQSPSSVGPVTVTTTYNAPSPLQTSYTPQAATSSSFRHQFSHSIPVTTTTQGVATAYVAVSPGVSGSFSSDESNRGSAGFSSLLSGGGNGVNSGYGSSSGYTFTAGSPGSVDRSSGGGSSSGSNGGAVGFGGHGYGDYGLGGYGYGGNGNVRGLGISS